MEEWRCGPIGINVSCTARNTNEEILRMIKKRDQELLITIKRRETAYVGHVIRNEKYLFLQLMFEGVRSKIGEESVERRCDGFVTSNSGHE